MCWILGIREVELFPEGLFLQKDTPQKPLFSGTIKQNSQ